MLLSPVRKTDANMDIQPKNCDARARQGLLMQWCSAAISTRSNDLKLDFNNPKPETVATELVCTSIASRAPPPYELFSKCYRIIRTFVF
jgi:hypothetical protein